MLLIPYQEDLRGKASVEINHGDYIKNIHQCLNNAEIKKAIYSKQTSNQLKRKVIKNGWPEVKAEVCRDIQAYFPF